MSGYAVSTEMLQLEASKIAQKFNIPVTEFKASYGWVQQFLNSWQLLIRRKTTISQELPKDYEEKLINFQKFVILLRKKETRNADQIPIRFDMLESTTIEHVGKWSLQVRTTGVDKQQCITMLAITVDGHELPPYVILREKKNSHRQISTRNYSKSSRKRVDD
jgi:hypothetical protein